MSLNKEYSFDTLLTSKDIKYIDRIIVSMIYEDIRCERCNSQLKYVNLLRIDKNHYNIGDNCYQSIKNKLSKLWKMSLYHTKIQLEEGYNKYLESKYSSKKKNQSNDISYKFDPEYSTYLTLEWDFEHGGLPIFREKEYKILKNKFKNIKRS